MNTVIRTINFGTDPEVVTYAYHPPQGALRIYTYGTDAEITRTGVGQYRATVPAAALGGYIERWAGTGPSGLTALDGAFTYAPQAAAAHAPATVVLPITARGAGLGSATATLGRWQLGAPPSGV